METLRATNSLRMKPNQKRQRWNILKPALCRCLQWLVGFFLLEKLSLEIDFPQRRRWCPWLCSLPSSSTLESLQLSIFKNSIKYSVFADLFRIWIVMCLMFADPSEKNCLYNRKDKLKKISWSFCPFLRRTNIKYAHITKNFKWLNSKAKMQIGTMHVYICRRALVVRMGSMDWIGSLKAPLLWAPLRQC